MDAPVLLVTGGSRGIGAAIALAGARAGYAILLSYASNADRAEAVVAQIAEAGGTARAVCADTGRADDVEALFAAVDGFGRLGGMVYSGGITGTPSKLADADPAEISRVVTVNLTGAMYCARLAIQRMSTARGGRGGGIVFLSSRGTAYGSPGEYVWYPASKGGIDALTLGLAREVGKDGIRVNAVSPGPIGTEMLSAEKQARAAALTALGRIGTPDEVAAAVMFLLSDDAAFVTGANLAVSGGR